MEYLDQSPEPQRPKKNFPLFEMDERASHFPKDILEGSMGPLPILMAVNVGYDPEDRDPYMYQYESQEVLFAFKKDSQTRVLLQDSYKRTLSLPTQSTLTFYLSTGDAKEETLSQILAIHSLPVTLHFAHPDTMQFQIGNQLTNHTFFGDLQLQRVYEEPFLWCLSIEGCRDIRENPRVLPRNLKDVCFAPVISVKGASDPKAKVKEFVEKFTEFSRHVDLSKDPFFQELAIVSRGPQEVHEVQPYIDHSTFVAVRYMRRPAPWAPLGKAPAPPPRIPAQAPAVCKKVSTAKMQNSAPKTSSCYTTLKFEEGEEHLYSEPGEICPTGIPTNPPRNVTYPLLQPKESEALSSRGGKVATLPGQAPPPLPIQSGKTASSSRGSPEKQFGNLFMKPAHGPIEKYLDTLTVDDVATVLKLLGLDKYVQTFRKNLIDGVLLQKLTEETIKSEFKLSEIEYLRLSTYLMDGHIPFTTQKKTGSFWL